MTVEDTAQTFTDVDLTGSTFDSVDLTGASFEHVDLSNATLRFIDLTGARLSMVDMVDVTIKADLRNVVINGVDIAPLVDAELDRRHPGRAAMRPVDADGFRAAWQLLEGLWDSTIDHARRLPTELLNERVDGEWSFLQTLRHLVFATDAWVSRAMLGVRAPWHPLSLPWEQMRGEPGYPMDKNARPSLGEVLAIMQDRIALVRDLFATLDDDRLAGMTEPVDGIGWPPTEAFPVREVLLTVLNEEWEHRMYAERDLDILDARISDGGPGEPR